MVDDRSPSSWRNSPAERIFWGHAGEGKFHIYLRPRCWGLLCCANWLALHCYGRVELAPEGACIHLAFRLYRLSLLVVVPVAVLILYDLFVIAPGLSLRGARQAQVAMSVALAALFVVLWALGRRHGPKLRRFLIDLFADVTVAGSGSNDGSKKATQT